MGQPHFVACRVAQTKADPFSRRSPTDAGEGGTRRAIVPASAGRRRNPSRHSAGVSRTKAEPVAP
jgi:hypothetical protein